MSEPTDKTVQLCSRTCGLCGNTEISTNGKPIYYQPGKYPQSTTCQHCGFRSLLPDGPRKFRVYQEEPALDWLSDKPRVGRPPKALVEKRQREATQKAQAA